MNFDRHTLPFIIRSGRRLKVARGIGRDAQDSQKAGHHRHFAVVTISDSGKGLNQEEIDEINQPFDYDWGYWKNENRGIGLRYVKAMLESFYDGQTSLFVNSKKGFGTKITILLPVREPEEKKEKDKEVTLEENKVGQTDERIDCR